jgi:hypothetical protein
MATPKIKKLSITSPDDYLIQLFILALNMLAGNLYFPTPIPTLPAVQSILDDFMAAVTASGAGGAGTVAIKNQQKLLLVNIGNKLIRYLNYTADGDLAKMQTVGFPVSNGVSVPQILGAITSFTAKHGQDSGEVDLVVKAVNGKGGMYSYTTYPAGENSVWKSTSCRNMKCTISNLTPGNKLDFQVTVMGTNDQFLTSQVVSIIVV